MARTPIVFVSGKHPIREIGGFGHSVYVRAHAMAAHQAGFDPQIFCVGNRDEREETPFGTIHQLASMRPFRQNAIPIHARVLARGIERYVAALSPRRVAGIHGFAVWTYAAVRAARALRARGIRAAAVGSSYTTYVDERRAMVAGIEPGESTAQRLGLYAELAWSPIVQWYEREAYRGCDLLTANYVSVVRMIERRHGSALRVRIGRYSAPSAFDDRPTLRPARAASPVVFVTVSGHYERKGMDVFLRALKQVADAGIPVRAICVGGGTLLEKHRALARTLGLGNVAELRGVVDAVQPFLDAADVFVLPSRSEQSGSLSVIEAMRTGLPTIASACDGIPEDLGPAASGILVEPGSVVSLAEAMMLLAQDAGLRARYAAEARAVFEARFSAEAFSADLTAAYAQAGIELDPGA